MEHWVRRNIDVLRKVVGIKAEEGA
jgi:hypothetical protein